MADAPPVGVELRRATSDDGDMLLAWRNDGVTRVMSRSSEMVTPEDHAGWMRSTLASTDRHLLIAVQGGHSIGQVRLDAANLAAVEVSITIAPEHRGCRLAAVVLAAAEAYASSIGAVRMTAAIRPQNEASIRAFKSAGWYGFVEATVAEERMLHCERSLRRAAQ